MGRRILKPRSGASKTGVPKRELGNEATTPRGPTKPKQRLPDHSLGIDPCYLHGQNDCCLCNNAKAAQTECHDPVTGRLTPLFNPRREQWSDHFHWSKEGTRILGKTPTGRATIVALQLNNLISVVVRRHWVAAGWHPPDRNQGQT